MKCHACDSGVDADDAFCRKCWARLQVPVGERRHLSVMFCDLVGSTALAGRLDPEDVQHLLDLYRREAGRIVAGLGGHVAQYLGDGLLVYFGYPVAHEDAPARAAAAGLRLAADIAELADGPGSMLPQEPLAVRVGIHSGPVALGSVGEGLGATTLATGQTVNIAARLSAMAEPGTVLISQDVADRLGSGFRLVPLGSHRLHGVETPLAVWRAVEQTRAAQPARWRAQLVGREAQLAELSAGFAAALRGEPRPLLVVGEAGIGKSRLVEAFRETLAGQDHHWLTLRGSGLHQNTPLHPVREALTPDLAALPAALQAMLSAPTRTAAERETDQQAMVAWLLDRARDWPVILHAEDLHWFDPSSLEILALLSQRLAGHRLLLLASIRPDAPPHGLADARSIAVPPLGEQELRRLVADLTDGLAPDDPAVTALARRAEGVPLFAEELARTLLEQIGESDEPLALPGSLQDLFAARLDRLGPAKSLVQAAALIGRSFASDTLAEVVGKPLHDVEAQLRLAVARQILRDVGGGRYLFHHALLQEAAASAMLRRHRREAHGRIAATLAGAADPPAAIVAHHFAAAGTHDRAIEWFGRAGEQALARASYGEAEAALTQAVTLFEARTEAADVTTMLQHYSRLNRVRQVTRGYADPLTVATARAARELAHRSGSLAALFREEERLLQAELAQGDYQAVLAHANELSTLAQVAGRDADMLLIAENAQVQVCFFTGDLAGVERHFRTLRPWVASVGRRQPPGNVVSAFGVAALCAAAMDDAALAEARLAEAGDFAAETGHSYDRAMVLHYQVQTLVAQGRCEAVLVAAAEQVAWSQEHGFAYLALLAGGALAWARGMTGEPGQTDILAGLIDAQTAAGARIAVTTQLNRLAEMHLVAGDLEAATATLARARAFNPQERVYAPAGHLIAARIAMARGDAAAAAAEAALAHAAASAMGARADRRRAEDLLATLPAQVAG